MSSVLQFLRSATAAAKAINRTHSLTFVLGNEGGDMDSCVSALFTALLFCQDWLKPTIIPVMNFNKDDFVLRKDVYNAMHLLLGESFNYREDLLFLSDAPLIILEGNIAPMCSSETGEALGKRFTGNDSFILVDHNELKSTQKKYQSAVLAVIDHHKDEKKFNACEGNVKLKIIDSVGSAATLVALLWKESGGFYDLNNSKPSVCALTPRLVPCPALLLSPILLDTNNNNNEKTALKDKSATQFLLEELKMQRTTGDSFLANFECESFTKQLREWKKDISNFTAEETLRRDFKRFDFSVDDGESVSCGISTVLIKKTVAQELYGDDDMVTWIPAIVKQAEQCDYDLHITMFNSGKSRQLEAVFPSAREDIKMRILRFIDSTSSSVGWELKKEYPKECGSPTSYTIYLWKQGDTKYSRKNLTPLIAASFKAKL